MVQVQDHDYELDISSVSFDPIFLGDKTCLVTHRLPSGDGRIIRLREVGSERVCEVEITHIEQFSPEVSLLSITLV